MMYAFTRVQVYETGATGNYHTEAFDDLAGLLELLGTHVEASSKYALAGIVPASRWEGPIATSTGREAARGRDAFVLPFDCDGPTKRGVPLERVHALAATLRAAGVAFALTSSYSSATKSDPDHARIHVVLLAECLADNAVYRATWRHWRVQIEQAIGSACDSVGEHIASVTYPPSCPPGAARLAIVNAGAPVVAAEPTDDDRAAAGAPIEIDAYEPAHPMPLDRRLELLRAAVAGKKLPRRSSTTSGHRGAKMIAALGPIVHTGMRFGVTFDALVHYLDGLGSDWTVEELREAAAQCWRYSDRAVTWESALPPVAAALAVDTDATPADPNALCVVGPPGCGKTKWTIERVRDAESLLWITPRVKQAMDAAARAGLELYGEPGDRDAARLATTAASAHKYIGMPRRVVVIDELATVVHEVSKASERASERTWEAIAAACAQAEIVIVLGADIDAECFALARSLTGRQQLSIVKLPGVQPLDRTLVIRHVNAVRPEIVASRPGCTFVAMDCANQASALGDILRATGKSVMVVRGGDDNVPTDADVLEHDYIIATHSMAEAINLTAPVAKVFVLHLFDEVHRDAMLQLAARCRNVADTEIVVGELDWGTPSLPDIDAVYKRIAEAGGKIDPTGPLLCRARRERRQLYAKTWPSLRWTETYPIVEVDLANPGPAKGLAGPVRAATKEVKRRRAQAVVDAAAFHEPLPVRPSEEQRAGKHRTELEALAIPVTLENVIADGDGGRLRKAVQRRALADITSDEELHKVCELIEPTHMAGRTGHYERARMDRDFLAAWREDPGQDWHAWSRNRRPRLESYGPGRRLPGKGQAARWARKWAESLDVPPERIAAWWVPVNRKRVVDRVLRRASGIRAGVKAGGSHATRIVRKRRSRGLAHP